MDPYQCKCTAHPISERSEVLLRPRAFPFRGGECNSPLLRVKARRRAREQTVGWGEMQVACCSLLFWIELFLNRLRGFS